MSVRRTAAALVGAVLLLAGCGGDPEPRFSPTESPSPSESETAAEPEAQTPEEFIREWFRVGTEMQNTGETAAFRAMGPSCGSCNDLADRVDRYYENGGYVRISRQDVIRIQVRSRLEFSVVVDAGTTTYQESAEGKRKTLPGGPNEFRVFVRRGPDGWTVTDFLDTPS